MSDLTPLEMWQRDEPLYTQRHPNHDWSECDLPSLSNVHKQVPDLKGSLFINEDTTHILGLLCVEGLTNISPGQWKYDSDGGFDFIVNSVLKHIMDKYVGTGDILSAQDEMIDAGYIEQARL